MEEPKKRTQISFNIPSQTQNNRVNELLNQYSKNTDLAKRIKYQSKQYINKNNHLLQNGLRKWLMKKGRGYLVDFDRRERRKLKDFFNSVDNRKEGYISLDQLEEMLLGLGLAEGIEDVKRLVNNVNVDQEGRIEFEEFMQIIQDDSKQNEQIVNFFKQLILSQIQQQNQKQKPTLLTRLNFTKTMPPTPSKKQIYQNKLPFQMIVNRITRNHILSSMNIGRCKINNQSLDWDKQRIKVQKGKDVVKAMHKMEERRIMRKLRETLQQSNNQTGQNNSNLKLDKTNRKT